MSAFFSTIGRWTDALNAKALRALHATVRMWRRTTRYDRAKLLALLALLLGLLYVAKWSPWASHFTQENMQATVAQWQPWGSIAFVAAYAIGAVIFMPQTLMIHVGVVIFGWIFGGVWALCGMTLGAALSYGVSRALGTSLVQHALGPGYATMQRHMNSGLELEWKPLGILRRRPFSLVPQAFWGVAVLRLLSAPFPAVSYLAGAMQVPFWPYLLGTTLGCAPLAFLFTWLFAKGLPWLPYAIDNWGFILVGLPLIALTAYFALYLVYYRLRYGTERFRTILRVPDDDDTATTPSHNNDIGQKEVSNGR